MTSAAATAAATGRELLTKLVTPGSTLNSNFTGPLFPEMLKHCKAVQCMFTVKAGVGVGFTKGTGFALAKLSTNADGTATWSAPIFLAAEQVSVGAVIGVMEAQGVTLINSESALSELKSNGIVTKLAVDAGAAIATEGAQHNLSLEELLLKDVATIGLAQGAMFDLSGVVGALRVDLKVNEAVYGRQVSAKDVLEGKVDMPQEFEPLVAKLNEILLSAKK